MQLPSCPAIYVRHHRKELAFPRHPGYYYRRPLGYFHLLQRNWFCRDLYSFLNYQYLLQDETNNAIPYSELFRLHRICSDELRFKCGVTSIFVWYWLSPISPKIITTTSACGRSNCKTCSRTKSWHHHWFTIGTNRSKFNITKTFTCSSSCHIYCIKCAKCGILYIGETCRELNNRVGGH